MSRLKSILNDAYNLGSTSLVISIADSKFEAIKGDLETAMVVHDKKAFDKLDLEKDRKLLFMYGPVKVTIVREAPVATSADREDVKEFPGEVAKKPVTPDEAVSTEKSKPAAKKKPAGKNSSKDKKAGE